MSTRTTVPTWRITETAGLETAWIDLGPSTLSARGRVAAALPTPYWLTYELETGEDFTTRRLHVTAHTPETVRTLDLRRDTTGRWTVDGTERRDLAGSLDCDLGLSPLTNTPPVLRHGLHRSPGEHHFLMAWVRVPDLTVHPSRQTYTHLRTVPDGTATVRFTSGDYRADLTVDADGLIRDYPELAQRLP
ncbi:putative glycolipid-binding domain-containing protein [Kitasatospora sp. NPDC001539]|uniref:putative glycolipid-binding domain-containing protein n=1 Tax=Kitasatospora sp. NPDC001539 TaxID=3154384 RepID=UPI0033294019